MSSVLADYGWNNLVSDASKRLKNRSVLPTVLEAKIRCQSDMAKLWEDPSQGCRCLSSCCVLAVQSDPSGTPFIGHRSHHEGFIHSDSPSCSSTNILVFGHWGGALFEKVRICDLDIGNVPLRVEFEVSKYQDNPIVSLFLIPADLDIEL